MNKIFYTLMIAFVSILMFTSCEREALSYDTSEKNNNTQLEGTLNLASLKVGVIPDDQTGVVTTRSNIDVSTFTVAVYEENSLTPLTSWKYAAMPEIFSLPVGTYRIDVYSHEPLDAEWNNPHFFASQTFDISKDKLKDLGTMICKMKSIKTSVVFTDDLKALLGNDIEVDIVANDKGNLTYDSNKFDTHKAYFKPDTEEANILKTALRGSIDGVSRNITNTFSNIKSGEHRIIQYSLKSSEGDTGEGGNAGFTIQIVADCTIVNENVNVDPGTEGGIDDFPPSGGDGNDDGGNTGNEDAPTIIGYEFNGASFNIDEPQTVSSVGASLKVKLLAPLKFAHVEVNITSATLSAEELQGVGLAPYFDLAYPETEILATGLAGLGFPVGDDVIGQTEIMFDISQFTGMLAALGAGTHTFDIKITDQASTPNVVTKRLTIITQ